MAYEDDYSYGYAGDAAEAEGGEFDSGAGKKVYFGNLPYSATWRELKDLARNVGNAVYATVPVGRDGRSRGYGLVEYETAEEAAAAISTLDGTDYLGRALHVRYDRPATSRRAPARRTRAAAGAAVLVTGLDPATEWKTVKDAMRSAGDVAFVDIVRTGGYPSGSAVVQFGSVEAAQTAVDELNGTEIDGNVVTLAPTADPEPAAAPAGGYAAPAGGAAAAGGEEGSPALLGSKPADSRNVFVNNLAYSTKWWALKDYMATIGEVEHVEVLGSQGWSRGCAIVTFADAAVAAQAIKELNETELDGRVIYVREDRGGRAAGEGRGGGRGGAGGDDDVIVDGSKLFVGNLPYTTTDSEVRELFAGLGIDAVEVDMPTRPDGRSRGYSLVKLVSEEEADRAIEELNSTKYDGRVLTVRKDRRGGRR
eukprot:PLAT15918.1.p1 GENE.PLAT15918.1~~PLAT15918.1.p1  ORF type:complete len:423 (+),score=210.50 PLAT15918.1:72-1340(+)